MRSRDWTRDLERLARDRPLLTRELHAVNAWYGHSHVLKRYAGWPRRRSLKVAIEHGPWIDDEIWAVDANTRMPVHLCAAPARAELFNRKTAIPATAIGPMIRYVLPEDPPLPERPRTVAFPAHSTHHSDAEFVMETFLGHLDRMAKSSEVVVCLYWRDVMRGLHHVFEERGFRCTCAGHIYDSHFLDRLASILASASRVLTNEVGTHVLYAALLGRPVQVVSQPIEYVQQRELADHQGDREHPRVRRTRTLFASPSDSLTTEQRQFIDEILGVECVRSPAGLTSLLKNAERLYRETPLRERVRVPLARERLYAAQALARLKYLRDSSA